MDFISIASMAIPAICPFLQKGGEAIAQGIGKDLWALIKKPFQSDKDKTLIKQFEEKPDDQKLHGKIEVKLSDFLEAYPEIAQRISELLPRAQEEAKRLNILIQNSKNVVAGSQIIAQRDVIVGDINIC